MTKEQYQTIHVLDLRELAKARGIKRTSNMKKAELIEAMTALDMKEAASSQAPEASPETVKHAEKVPHETESAKKGTAEKAPSEKTSADKKSVKRAPAKKPDRKTTEQKRSSRRTSHKEEPAQDELVLDEQKTVIIHDEETSDSALVERSESVPRIEPVKAAFEKETSEKEPEPAEDKEKEIEPRRTSPPRNAGPQSGAPNAKGILEVMADGFGFLRSSNFLPGEEDIYVSPSQIRRFNLKTGDLVEGHKRAAGQQERYGALLYVSEINGFPAEEARKRSVFENMTPIFPNERIRLERPGGSRASRIIDLISPIGKGQRGMIVSPPKAGKTTLLKDVAKSILASDPEANLIILLIDERPEEVTDMKESVSGKNVEIIYSTFDELPEHHRRVAEMVIERAKRLVEHHQDVIILLDSITRLTRAYNILVPQSGRTLSGGLDPTALHMPKRFFGAARNMREGGSLTILATALVDTGSKMDDVVYEEFKGTGNMELILDRKLQERRIFPAIDIVRSGTRREDLLLTPREQRAVDIMRRRINGMKAEDSIEQILNAFAHYPTNEQVINAILSKWQ